MTTQSKLDRRAPTRPQNPPCRKCGASGDDVTVTIRTAYLFYVRCDSCGHVWQEDMPPLEGPRRHR
jgi:uncharacterized Zn finger protein